MPDDRSSRSIHLAPGLRRDRDLNTRTVVLDLGALERRAPPFEALFLAHYRVLRELARRERPGLGLVAVSLDSCELAGHAWVGRRDDRANALIVGRHSECDLVLPSESVSLRHLALLLPTTARWPMQYTVHELQTGVGLRDGVDRAICGARVERAGLFRVGPYALFTVATGAPREWPELASEAWARLGGSTVALREPRPRGGSQVTEIRGPMVTSQILLPRHELRMGTLEITTESRSTRLALGPSALERGVLLGRYPRCESTLLDTSLSRVHLLVIDAGGEIVGVDTGSTHGVYLDEGSTDRARVVRLSRGEAAVLAHGAATVRLR